MTSDGVLLQRARSQPSILKFDHDKDMNLLSKFDYNIDMSLWSDGIVEN